MINCNSQLTASNCNSSPVGALLGRSLAAHEKYFHLLITAGPASLQHGIMQFEGKMDYNGSLYKSMGNVTGCCVHLYKQSMLQTHQQIYNRKAEKEGAVMVC